MAKTLSTLARHVIRSNQPGSADAEPGSTASLADPTGTSHTTAGRPEPVNRAIRESGSCRDSVCAGSSCSSSPGACTRYRFCRD